MNTYNPDKWMIMKVTSGDPHYRVFGSWSGGYTTGDSWRMNSGIEKVEETENTYRFIGSSGSVYECVKGMYGVTAYGYGIASNMVEQQPDMLAFVDETDWKEELKDLFNLNS